MGNAVPDKYEQYKPKTWPEVINLLDQRQIQGDVISRAEGYPKGCVTLCLHVYCQLLRNVRREA